MSERWTPAYDRLFDPEHELAYGPTCPRFAWLDLCHNARWRDGARVINGVVVPLKRGELVASLRWMSERWGWSTKKVRSFVNLLSRPEIAKLETVRETPQGTVYRIVKYDTWADPGNDPGHSKSHTRGTPGAHPGHKEQQGTSGFNNSHDARDELSMWLGEHAETIADIDFVGGDDRRTLWQHYGPPGLRSSGWKRPDGSSLPPSERPRVFALALTGYAIGGKTKLIASEFAGTLRRTIADESRTGVTEDLSHWDVT